ncbi:MAG: c-type cytochrome [Chitinophagaceae bacterium]
MKKLSIIAVVTGAVVLAACSDVKRKPGKIYMPDMAYSRAYEAYSVTEEQREELKKQGINFSNLPVAGTVSRGEMLPYHLQNDSIGYAMSASVKNPLPALSEEDMTQAERLYLINCGICHGQALDGNGPLYKDGAGPYPAAPKNLLSDELKKMADGTMFHSITYGKNLMGSYASQLTRKQRWMVVHYIRNKQGLGAGAPAATADSTAAPKADSTATK